MAKLPFMRIYVPDLISDTYTLSDGEFGAYTRILFALWRHKGVLPFDDRVLAKVAGSTRKTWPSRWAAIAGYFVVADGFISHARISEDLLSASKTSHGNDVEGFPGESSPPRKSLKNNDPTSPPGYNHEPELEPESEIPPVHSAREPATDWPDGGIDVWMAKLAAVGRGFLDPMKNPRLIDSRGIVAQWKLNGFSFSLDVLPTVQAACRRKTGPVGSWEYFNRPVRETYARRMKAAAPITTADLQPHQGDHRDDKLARKNDEFARHIAATERLAAEYGERG
jgi:uncharacterized protein YdaU (DUF1376 family)